MRHICTPRLLVVIILQPFVEGSAVSMHNSRSDGHAPHGRWSGSGHKPHWSPCLIVYSNAHDADYDIRDKVYGER